MKILALQFIRGCGIFSVARNLSAGMGRILMYHNFCDSGRDHPDHVNVRALSAQFEYLRRHFHVVPLSCLVERLRANKSLDHGTVSVTVDDGRRNFYQFLYPLLKKLGIPATFFVVSAFIRGEDWIWTDKVLWLSERASRPAELAPGGIDAYFRKLNALRPAVRNALIETMSERMNTPIPKNPPTKYEPCSWGELREMADSGLVEIGSHTVTHPILSSLTDEETWQELILSRKHIEQELNRPVESFCFPNGKPEDFRASQVQLVREAKYTSAVVTSFGMVSHESDPYRLPRIGVAGSTGDLMFAKNLDGVEYYQVQLQTLLGLRLASA